VNDSSDTESVQDEPEENAGEEATPQSGPGDDAPVSEPAQAEVTKRDDGDDDPDRASQVADALGVGDGEDAEDPAEAAPAENRNERRRKRAAARRARRKGVEVEGDKPAADRNKRQRDLLERRRGAAQADDDEGGPGKLLPSEMIDDALTRGTASSIKWLQRHWSTVQWFVAAGIVGGAGFLFYTYRVTSHAEDASAVVVRGAYSEQALVFTPDQDKRTDDQKKNDPRQIFASRAKRDEMALADYRKAFVAYPDIGPGILGRLGEAGVLLDQGEYDAAIKAYDEVLGTALAAADVDVKARALEGKGFGQEGKKDLAGATKTFEAMGKLSGAAYRFTARYHRARILLAEGKRDEAKTLLSETRKKVEMANLDAAGIDGATPHRWLMEAITATLRMIDPKAAPPPPSSGGFSQEKLQEMLRRGGLSGQIPGLPGGIPGR